MEDYKAEEMSLLIQNMRRNAEDLTKKANGIQAVTRNVERILANIKMLELNISDLKGLRQEW